MKPRNRLHTLQYQVGDRWYTVEATNGTLQDLCMGPHARQADIKTAKQTLGSPEAKPQEIQAIMDNLDTRKPQANGELKGVRLRWPRVNGKLAIPPFSSGVLETV